MEENQNGNFTEEKKTYHECDKKSCWIKFLVLTIAAFLGAFLAVYFIADNLVYRYIIPPTPKIINVGDIDDLIKQQEKMMDDITTMPVHVNPFMINPVQIHTYQDDDDYKIVINLKPFNGKADNIKVDVKSKSIKLSGESDLKTKNTAKDISFTQSFSLPKKIDVKNVKKEVKGDKYIITLPIED